MSGDAGRRAGGYRTGPQAFARLGSRVIVLERLPQILSWEVPEPAAALRGILMVEGVEVHTSTSAERIQWEGADLVVDCNGRRSVVADRILAATGRTPNAEGLGLDLAGVETVSTAFGRTSACAPPSATSTPAATCVGPTRSPTWWSIKLGDHCQQRSVPVAAQGGFPRGATRHLHRSRARSRGTDGIGGPRARPKPRRTAFSVPGRRSGADGGGNRRAR
ncbi:MAG: FAD-dependent oxidoreductase [Gammaproteobacteria bacterium]